MHDLMNDPHEPARASIPWIYLSTISFFLAGGVFYLYLARIVPTSEVGTIVVLSAVAAIVSAACSLGLGSGFQHFLSYHIGMDDPLSVRALVRSSLLAALVLSTLAAAVTIGLASAIGNLFFHSSAYTEPLELLGLFSGLSTCATVLQSVLLGLQKFIFYSAVAITGNVATYGLAVVFLIVRPGVTSVVEGWTVGAGLACVLYTIGIYLHPLAPSKGVQGNLRPTALYRAVLAYSLPLFAAALIGTGTTYVDRLVLASIADLSSVGIYNYAILVAAGSLFVVSPFGTLLVPKISELLGAGNLHGIRYVTRTAGTLVVLVYVPFALGLAALAPILLGVLAGPGFVSASLPMALLLLLTAIFIPYAVLSSLAAGIRRTQALVKASVAALVVNIALSIVLVPKFGMIGAALGNSAMSWAAFGVLYWELRNTGLVRFDFGALMRIWLAAGAMALAVAVPLEVMGYSPLRALLMVGAGLVVLLVGLRWARALNSDLTAFLVRALPRRLHWLRPGICWVAACQNSCGHDLSATHRMSS
ncbi:MAG: lipid II flippase MurJ [Thermoplasmata archaeon]